VIEGPRTDEAGPNVDPTGAPVEDAGSIEEPASEAKPKSGRVLDRGAIFAGWVGIGMASVIAITGLVIPVQTLTFLMVPFAGLLIGYYANQRSARFRPRWRLFVNAAYASVVTGLSLALMYAILRLLFFYADFGFRAPGQGGQIQCSTGPECTYARLLEAGEGTRLLEAGIVDAGTFEAAWLTALAQGAITIVALTIIGGLVAAGVRALRKPPRDRDIEPAMAGAAASS
jgi:hypothetical protein